jgi:hypothetical protein
MTIARRPPEAGPVPERGDDLTPSSPVTTSATTRPVVEHSGSDVPAWGLAAGLVLVLVFAVLVVQTYSGRSLLNQLATLVPGSRSELLADADRSRVLYASGSTVQVGEVGIGARGHDRAFQAGDIVLLGATGRLVRLEEVDRLTELHAPEGTALLVTSLGPWDPAAGSLAGSTARYVGGSWVLETPPLQPAGAALHVPGAPEEELTADFQLIPPMAGRIRRLGSPDGPVIRVRPAGRAPALLLEGSDPLTTLDNVAVTVQATVRASEGATVELALADVVDAVGTVQKTVDRGSPTDEEAWTTLRIRRRVVFGSPNDRYSLGLVEVRNRDWLEVRELSVYIGVLP